MKAKSGRDVWEALAPLLLLLVFGLLYEQIGQVAQARGVDYGPMVVTSLDVRVPFLPFFFPAYALFWIAPIFAFSYLYWKLGWDPGPYRRILVALLVLSVGCTALWILFPVAVDLRAGEEELAEHGLLGSLISLTYSVATKWNACPSFHVAGTWLLYRTIRLLVPAHTPLVPITAFLIIVSTVLIRIHYLLDIPAGLLASEAAYRLILRPMQARGSFQDVPGGRGALWSAIVIFLGLVSFVILLVF